MNPLTYICTICFRALGLCSEHDANAAKIFGELSEDDKAKAISVANGKADPPHFIPPLDRDRFLERIAVALEKRNEADAANADVSGKKLLAFIRHWTTEFCTGCGMPVRFMDRNVNWCDAECPERDNHEGEPCPLPKT